MSCICAIYGQLDSLISSITKLEWHAKKYASKVDQYKSDGKHTKPNHLQFFLHWCATVR